MASIGPDEDEDLVVLEIIDSSSPTSDRTAREADHTVSAYAIDGLDLPTISPSGTVKVRASRTRLIERSSYFRSLFGGKFSESSLSEVSVRWNLEVALNVVKFIHGCSVHVTDDNFIRVLEGALFFGVETLLSECEAWFQMSTIAEGGFRHQISMDTVIEIWNYCMEHSIGSVSELCKSYIARNFAWAISSRSFIDVPYSCLRACLEDPQLTVDSEKQLCEGLLEWLASNAKSWECSVSNLGNEFISILNMVRICFLPLDFVAGQRRSIFFSKLAYDSVNKILDLMKGHPMGILHVLGDSHLHDSRIRLTQYSKKIDLSGCAHISIAFLVTSIFLSSTDADATSTEILREFLSKLDGCHGRQLPILAKSFSLVSFKAVAEVDLSKCPKLQLDAAIDFLHLSFPSLRILKVAYCSQLKTRDLFDLMQKCPLIDEVDFTVDISPVLQTKVSVISVSNERCKASGYVLHKAVKERSMLSSITKLTLEGRTDIDDVDLSVLAGISDTLSYINLNGCSSITDLAISNLISKCMNLQSIIVSLTSFGRYSILALCSDGQYGKEIPEMYGDHKPSSKMTFGLQKLHIDGCKGVDHASMHLLMSTVNMLKSLSLRGTLITDDALCAFLGSSLERLDVSETMISVMALACIIRRNTGLRIIRARDCKALHCIDAANVSEGHDESDAVGLHAELGNKYILEEIAFGWGFSFFSLEKLKPALVNLKTITLGLGASIGQHGLALLPTICPLLESIVLKFQVIDDHAIRSILEGLRYLQVLELCCCLGDLTPLSFQFGMPNLRTLRLERVTPWMENDHLIILTQNCSNLIELSLSGCQLLGPESQQIISSGWPGLTLIHLEDCGKVTSNGVSSLFDCKGVEDLLLRHNGQGIGRGFIIEAASKLPLLRKVALDLCDAYEGGFESPSYNEKFFLTTAKIARCKKWRCAFELQSSGNHRAVHMETIILEWNSKEQRTTVVKERV